MLGMIKVTASMYAACQDIRLLGDYVCFANYFFVHKDFMRPTPKQQALIDAGTRRCDNIVRDTGILMDNISTELRCELRGIENTRELREVGSEKGGYALGRVFAQLSVDWDKEPIGMNEEYFQAIVRKSNYYPWQDLNSPLSPILVCQDSLRPTNEQGRVVAVIMPFNIRR